MTLAEMKERLQGLLNQVSDLQASDEDGAVEKLVNVLDQAEKLQTTIAAKERAEKLTAHASSPAPRVVKPAASPAPATKLGLENKLDAFIAALPFGAARLQNAAGDVFQEGVNGDGGYLLPVDKRALVKLLTPPTSVHSMCDIIFTESNAVTVPLESDAAWSADLAATDPVAEDTDLVEDKLGFSTFDASLTKSGVLVRVTREMLEDTTGIGEYVTGKLAEKLAWKLHAKAIQAFLASGGKVTAAKTVGAAAGSAPDLDNIIAIWQSMLPQHRAEAVFLINPRLEGALMKLVIGQYPVYIPANGLADQPYGRLFGRPVIPVEGLPAVGTEGDFMLVSPKTCYCIMKASGSRVEQSIHAEFKRDVVQYRGYLRSVCKSKFAAPITRADGTTAGNVVTLATRA